MTNFPDNKRRRVLLGQITGVHGIRGEVVIKTYTAEPQSIGAYGALEDDAGRLNYEISVVRVTPKGVIGRVTGIADRTEAEKLKGAKLYVARERLPKEPAGEFYHADLVGLAVFDPEGRSIGEIVAVHNFGAGDLLEITLAGSKETELVPFTNTIVPEVDIAAGRAVVVMPVMTDAEENEAGQPPKPARP